MSKSAVTHRELRHHNDPHHRSNWCQECGLYYCWHPECKDHKNDLRSHHKFIPEGPRKINIIAEFGVNWKNTHIFRQMIKKCIKLDIKYVKMQLFEEDKVPDEIKPMTLDFNSAAYFFGYAKSKGIELFFTPMYLEAVDICEKIGVNYYKIRYLDRYNAELVGKIKETGKPCFISLGKLDIYHEYWRKFIKHISLFCIPKYPCRFEDYEELITFGYSDHTPDLRLYKYARSVGAKWFEMHVKLNDDCYEAAWSKSFEQLKEVLL